MLAVEKQATEQKRLMPGAICESLFKGLPGFAADCVPGIKREGALQSTRSGLLETVCRKTSFQ